jgi:hypothetical protein
MKKLTTLALTLQVLATIAAVLIPAAGTNAGSISTANALVVVRVGDGTSALSGVAAPVYLEEYSVTFDGTGVPTSATHVQTIPVPNTGVTGTHLTMGGTAALEGSLNFSANGQYLMFAGYDSLVGGVTQGTPRKIIGRLDLAGNLAFDAVYGPGSTQANSAMRTVTSSTGNEYWFGMSGATAGTSYRAWTGLPGDDGDNSGVLSVSLNGINTRRLEVYNGQLYVDSAAGSIFGVATVGSGLPTTSGQTVTILPGMPTASGPSPIDFWFADDNTLYVADDRTSTSGGLQKWALESGTWVLKYTKNIDTTNDSIDNGLRGLTGSVGTDGSVVMFGTTTFGSGATANFLVGITDTLANTNPANVTVNSLASAASIPGVGGSIAHFRGLEDVGVFIPEPASFALLAIGGLFLLSARRRQT